ncbi:phosphatidate phosphatase LPIN3-like [Sycon ciliatum]|uniref:phosphatidate phosphatase LPIN3-like n=1 Tax=Sycon ciliatum TaxID=27933 RepID=UPI0031F685F5
MNYVGRFLTTCKDLYNDINAATLTGAIDVIVVEQEDGTLLSSPFHVRFGKLGVLRYKGKTVDIRVNGDEVLDLPMRLGDSGVAYFVDELDPGEDGDTDTEVLDDEATPGRGRSHSCNSIDPTGDKSAAGDGSGQFLRGHQRTASTDSDVSFKSFQPIGNLLGEEKLLTPGEGSSLTDLADRRSTGSGEGPVVVRRRHSLSGRRAVDRNARQALSKSMCGLPYVSRSAHPVPKLFRTHSNPDIRIPAYLRQQAEVEESRRAADNAGQGATAFGGLRFGDAGFLGGSGPLDPAILEGLHSLSDSELMHEGLSKADEGEMSWPWGGLPTTQHDSSIKTKGESTPANASSTMEDISSDSLTLNAAAAKCGDELQQDQRNPAVLPSRSSSIVVSMMSRLWGSSSEAKTDVAKEKGGVYLSELNTADMDPTTESLYFQRKHADHTRTSSLPTPVPMAAGSRSDVKSDSDTIDYLQHMPSSSSVESQPPFSSSAPPAEQHCVPPPSHVARDAYSDSGASSMAGSPPPRESHLALSEPGSGAVTPQPQDEPTKHFLELLAPGSVEFSNCGGLKDSEKEPDQFAEHRISFEEFADKPELLSHSGFVVRIKNRYYTWQAAAPIIMSMVVYGRPLPERAHHHLMKQHMPRKRRFMWFWRGEDAPLTSGARSQSETNILHTSNPASAAIAVPSERKAYHHGFSSDDEDIGATDEVHQASDYETTTPSTAVQSPMARGSALARETSLLDARDENDSAHVLQHSMSLPVESTSPSPLDVKSPSDPWRATIKGDSGSYLRLPSEKLKGLRLKDGANTFTFSVTTKYQGTVSCEATVYLWHHTDQVVVSDVDGTITRSDVYGQVLPLFGQDWSHFGVAQLFSGIENNGYRFIYLSARAIGQSKLTRDYLRNIRQGQLSLPDGPLLLNPSSLVRAFHREVIMKNPQEFKIAALKDIGFLFCRKLTDGPYYAGFGNRMSDVITYLEVGVPKARIFTINPNGELRHEFIRTFKSTYADLTDLLDQFFPPRDEVDASSPVAYNQFNYWRTPMPVLDLDKVQK